MGTLLWIALKGILALVVLVVAVLSIGIPLILILSPLFERRIVPQKVPVNPYAESPCAELRDEQIAKSKEG
jgi:hypothetical protein